MRALECIESINNNVWRLKPQIALLTLKIMADLGDVTMASREALLSELSELECDEIVEARASWLLDSGEARSAYDLLVGHFFQLIHQRYERTDLLQRAAAHLGLTGAADPTLVGEDRLAQFGAYQEY